MAEEEESLDFSEEDLLEFRQMCAQRCEHFRVELEGRMSRFETRISGTIDKFDERMSQLHQLLRDRGFPVPTRSPPSSVNQPPRAVVTSRSPPIEANPEVLVADPEDLFQLRPIQKFSSPPQTIEEDEISSSKSLLTAQVLLNSNLEWQRQKLEGEAMDEGSRAPIHVLVDLVMVSPLLNLDEETSTEELFVSAASIVEAREESPAKAEVPSTESLLPVQVLLDSDPELQEWITSEGQTKGENSFAHLHEIVVDVAAKGIGESESDYEDNVHTRTFDRNCLSLGVNETDILKAETKVDHKVFVKMSESTVKFKSTRSYQDAFKLFTAMSERFLGFRMIRCGIVRVAKAEVDMKYGSTCLMFDPGGKQEKRGLGIYFILFETFAVVVFDPRRLLIGMTLLLVKEIYEAGFKGVCFVLDSGGALETRDRLWEFEWKGMDYQGSVKLGLLRHGITWDAGVLLCGFCLQLKQFIVSLDFVGVHIHHGFCQDAAFMVMKGWKQANEINVASMQFKHIQWDPGKCLMVMAHHLKHKRSNVLLGVYIWGSSVTMPCFAVIGTSIGYIEKAIQRVMNNTCSLNFEVVGDQP